MSKEIRGTVQGTPSHGTALVIGSWIPDSLVGRVLEIIEAIGLPEKQETSIKNLVKDVIYAKTTEEKEAAFICSDLHNAIRKAYEKNPMNVDLASIK